MDTPVERNIGPFTVRTYHSIRDEYFLGHGAFGQVVKAFRDGVQYAAKRIAMSLLDERLKKSILDNEDLPDIKNLQHGNIIKIFYREQKEGDLWIIMEYCKYTLFEYLEKENPQQTYIEAVLIQVSSGVEYLHSKKLAHRDLKPDNIMIKDISTWPWVKISDFGLAIDWSLRPTSSLSSVMGNTHWLPPELLDDHGNRTSVVHAKFYSVDMYSLGLVCAFTCMDDTGQEFICKRTCKTLTSNKHIIV